MVEHERPRTPVSVLGGAGRGARIGRHPLEHLIEARRVGRRHRRVERAGESVRRVGERKVGVAAGELPAVGSLQREIREVDLHIERLRRRSFGWRARQERGAVERFGQIARGPARRHFRRRGRFVGREASACGNEQTRRQHKGSDDGLRGLIHHGPYPPTNRESSITCVAASGRTDARARIRRSDTAHATTLKSAQMRKSPRKSTKMKSLSFAFFCFLESGLFKGLCGNQMVFLLRRFLPAAELRRSHSGRQEKVLARFLIFAKSLRQKIARAFLGSNSRARRSGSLRDCLPMVADQTCLEQDAQADPVDASVVGDDGWILRPRLAHRLDQDLGDAAEDADLIIFSSFPFAPSTT